MRNSRCAAQVGHHTYIAYTLTLSHSLCVSRYTQNHAIISGRLTEGAVQPSPKNGIRSRCIVVVAVQVWIV